MSLIRTAYTICRKDLREYFRDRSGALLGFALPLALVTIFGIVMSFAYGGDGGMGAAELWVSDADDSEDSRAFVEALREAETVRLRPRESEEAIDADGLQQKIEDGEAHHGLLIEAGFGAAIEAGEIPTLRMLRDPGREMEDIMLGIGTMQAFMEVTNGRVWPAMFGQMLKDQGMPESMVDGVVAATESTRVIMESWLGGEDDAVESGEGGAGGGGEVVDEGSSETSFDMSNMFTSMVPMETVDIQPPDRPKQLGYMQSQSVAGITVMMLMFGLVACGATLIREREEGTLPRLLVYAPSSTGVLLGKYWFTVSVGLMQLLVLFTWGEFVFKLQTFQDPLTLLVLCVTTTCAVASFGMLVAAWARSQKQADGLSTLLILIQSALGGAWFPLQIMNVPEWVEWLMRCTLTHWAMTAFQGMFWSRQSFTEGPMLTSIVVLWGFAIVATLLATRLFRRNYLNSKT